LEGEIIDTELYFELQLAHIHFELQLVPRVVKISEEGMHNMLNIQWLLPPTLQDWVGATTGPNFMVVMIRLLETNKVRSEKETIHRNG